MSHDYEIRLLMPKELTERFGQNVTVTMICKTCEVDRFKLPCPSREICPMKATTGGQP
jgi:hypothetical protein